MKQERWGRWGSGLFRVLDRHSTAWLLLAAGLVVTVAGSIGARLQLLARDEARFVARTERYRNALVEELDGYVRLLNGARALWGLHPPVSREEWRVYVEALALSNSYPSLQAMGFIERARAGTVERAGVERPVPAVTKGSAMHGEGARAEPYLVKFVEPLEPNLSALGYDVRRDPIWRQTAEEAWEQGQYRMTHKTTILPGSGEPGRMLLLPVFSAGTQATNAALSGGSLLGWVYAGLRVQDLLRRVGAECREEVEGELLDADVVPEFAGTGSAAEEWVDAPQAMLERVLSLEYAGSVWRLRLRPGVGFARTSWFSAPGQVPAATLGLSISLLVFGFARSISNSRQRAQDCQKLALSQGQLQETLKQLKASHEELSQAQFQLIQAAKMECLGTLAAGVAHEVKNPLQTILTGLDYLKLIAAKPGNEVERALADMREAVGRADRIVRELLQLSRNTEFEITEGNLNAVIERALRLLNSELLGNQTQVKCRLQATLPPVRMDTSKMEQVVLNLCLNALQAMRQGGLLLLTTRSGRLGQELELKDGNGARFRWGEPLVIMEVQDNGPGIAEEHLARMFEPFFTTKPAGQGTGLGLCIVKKIIELHEGSIEIGNAPEGGAVVRVTLRAQPGAPSRQRADNMEFALVAEECGRAERLSGNPVCR